MLPDLRHLADADDASDTYDADDAGVNTDAVEEVTNSSFFHSNRFSILAASDENDGGANGKNVGDGDGSGTNIGQDCNDHNIDNGECEDDGDKSGPRKDDDCNGNSDIDGSKSANSDSNERVYICLRYDCDTRYKLSEHDFLPKNGNGKVYCPKHLRH